MSLYIHLLLSMIIVSGTLVNAMEQDSLLSKEDIDQELTTCLQSQLNISSDKNNESVDNDKQINIRDDIRCYIASKLPITRVSIERTNTFLSCIGKKFAYAHDYKSKKNNVISIIDLLKPFIVRYLDPTEHTDDVNSFDFSSCGNYALTGSRDQSIKRWDLKRFECLDTFHENEPVIYVRYSPCGKYCASVTSDRTMKLWNLELKKCVKVLKDHTIHSIAFSPSGEYLACGSKNIIKMWRVENEEYPATLEGHSRSITSIQFSPCGKFLISGSFDNTIKMWDVASEKCFKTMIMPIDACGGQGNSVVDIQNLFVSFTSDGEYIMSLADNGIWVWDAKTGACLKTKKIEMIQDGFLSSDAQAVFSFENSKGAFNVPLLVTLSKYLSQETNSAQLSLLNKLSQVITDKNEVDAQKKVSLTSDQQEMFNSLGGDNEFGTELRKILKELIH